MACAQSFAPWQQATIEITRRDHSIIACSRQIHNGVILHAHPVRGESHNQRNTTGEVATVPSKVGDVIKEPGSFSTSGQLSCGCAGLASPIFHETLGKMAILVSYRN